MCVGIELFLFWELLIFNLGLEGFLCFLRLTPSKKTVKTTSRSRLLQIFFFRVVISICSSLPQIKGYQLTTFFALASILNSSSSNSCWKRESSITSFAFFFVLFSNSSTKSWLTFTLSVALFTWMRSRCLPILVSICYCLYF